MKPFAIDMLARVTGRAILLFAQLVTAVRGIWSGVEPYTDNPRENRRVYFANHASHGDFVLIWTVLPRQLRRVTRPVAGSDYWLKGAIRRFIGQRVFNSVLIDRQSEQRTEDPIAIMGEALDQGDSLIIFPEGTRNTTDHKLLPFKAGLYHLAKGHPTVQLIPVWIDNLNRVMPKGEIVPVPLICSVTFGEPIQVNSSEEKEDFLQRAHQALLALAPKNNTHHGRSSDE